MKRLLRILSAVMIIAILACVCVACDKDTPTDKTNPNGGATENGGNGTSGGTNDEETTIDSVIGKLYKFDRVTYEYTEEEWKKAYDDRYKDELWNEYVGENDDVLFNDDFKNSYNDCSTKYWLHILESQMWEIEFKADGSVESLFLFRNEENIIWVKTDDEIKVVDVSENWHVKAVGKNEIAMYAKLEERVNDDYRSPEKVYYRFVETKVAGTVSGKTYEYEKSFIQATDSEWNAIYRDRMALNEVLEEPIFTENDILNDDFKEKCNKAFAEQKGSMYKGFTFTFNENGEFTGERNGQAVGKVQLWEQVGNTITYKPKELPEGTQYGAVFHTVMNEKELRLEYQYMDIGATSVYVVTYLTVAE